MALAIEVELDGAPGVIVRLSDVPKRLRGELRRTMREIGVHVAADAKSEAASFSTRIPGAISTQVSFAASKPGATVRVNAARAPHARALELGNASTGQTRSQFRHPVFGNTKVWVSQDTHPFLFPSGKKNRSRAVHLMQDALRAAIHK